MSDRVTLALDTPRLVAILNVTPDSFHSGSRSMDPGEIRDWAVQAQVQGADIVDIGGESTRPGAPRVDAAEQIRRIVPAIKAIRDAGVSLAISIDTTRAAVARAALDHGADAINDTSGGTEDPELLAVAARHRAGLVLMHRIKSPTDDRYSDRYVHPPMEGDVVATVRDHLRACMARAVAEGVAPEAIILDPGLGFGKTVEQNLDLVRGTPRLLELGRPVMSALSRKSFVGRVGLERDSTPEERLAGTLAMSVAHWRRGARIFRVHDVAAHREALRVARAVDCPISAASGGPPAPDR